jgi:hypothetical protein
MQHRPLPPKERFPAWLTGPTDWHGPCNAFPRPPWERLALAPDDRRPWTRSGDRVLALLLSGALLLGATLGHGAIARKDAQARLQGKKELASQLQLTDLALFTEARYARHPAMTDRFAAFQNHPMALEHFPAGALIRPPVQLHE